MKKIVPFLPLLFVFLMFSCGLPCVRVTGPNDIAYTEISEPDCASPYYTVNECQYLINSALDFDQVCPGGTAPASWNFTNKTYIIVTAGHTAKAPYLAGVGTDPGNANQVLITIGLPCNTGMVNQSYEIETWTLELAKTTKTLRVAKVNE
jgi:hypothetical protein